MNLSLKSLGFIKELKIFSQSITKKQDVFAIFTDWLRQEFDFPVAKNFECSTIVIVMPLVLIMKDKVDELYNLDNLGLKAFAIGTRDEEVFTEGATIGGDRTVGMLPRNREFFAESTNALSFSLISPMYNVWPYTGKRTLTAIRLNGKTHS